MSDENGVYGDAWEFTSQPTPGYANNDAGHAQFWHSSRSRLAVGDHRGDGVLTRSNLQEEDGRFYDWIELCNRSDEPVEYSRALA